MGTSRAAGSAARYFALVEGSGSAEAYTLTYAGFDRAGNTASSTAIVRVRHESSQIVARDDLNEAPAAADADVFGHHALSQECYVNVISAKRDPVQIVRAPSTLSEIHCHQGDP